MSLNPSDWQRVLLAACLAALITGAGAWLSFGSVPRENSHNIERLEDLVTRIAENQVALQVEQARLVERLDRFLDRTER